MRILVTGTQGQVARALQHVAASAYQNVEILLLGRPRIDLADHQTLHQAIVALNPDIVVNAAAYTAVDQAESHEALAHVINAEGAIAVASAAAACSAPIVQLSTDYVFDGQSSRPYLEDDVIGPLNAYGRSKAVGEIGVARANPNYVILRTSWLYSPFSQNFARTMLRLAGTHDVIRVVADQNGAPTSAFEVARAIIDIANRVTRDDDSKLRGLFHVTNAGVTTWADFAQAVFDESAARGSVSARVERITTQDYPTPARRPQYSVLNNSKLEHTFGILLPDWRESIGKVIEHCIANEAR